MASILRNSLKIINFSKVCSKSLISTTKFTTCLSAPAYGFPLSFQNAQIRASSFFSKMNASRLWESVIGPPKGKKKNRGKSVAKRRASDLNRGQKLGDGRAGMLWPGFNAPVISGNIVVKRQQVEVDPEKKADIIKMRDKMQTFRRYSLPPLLRGWSGSRYPGQSIGPPDPVGDYVFHGFDTRVLEFKMVSTMTANLGRKPSYSAFVVTGNRNGLAGFALAKAPSGRAAIRNAKNKAAQRLQYIERFDDHTLFHDMYSKYMFTKLFIQKKHKGYGVKAHRGIRTICELIGIKDMYAKVEGSTGNIQNLTKAFFSALGKQETHSDLAERINLHVVEQREERDHFPVAVASPSTPTREIGPEEDLNFVNLYYGGKVPLKREKRPVFYANDKSYKKRRAVDHRYRNQIHAQIIRRAKTEV